MNDEIENAEEIMFVDMMVKIANTLHTSDAFFLLPMKLSYVDGNLAVDCSIQVNDCINLTHGAEETCAIYLAALTGMLKACCAEVGSEATLDHLSAALLSMAPFKENETKH